jgi:NTE family protein/lysophospholipid hydrolase
MQREPSMDRDEPALDRAELLELFRSVDPFSSLTARVLDDLVDACDIVNARGGSLLSRAGSRLDALYGVVHGALRVVRTDDDGTHTTIRELYRGETLGVMGMFVKRPTPVDVVVIRDSTILRLPRDRFLALTRKHPTLHDAFTEVMGAHMYDLLGTITTGQTAETGARGGGNLGVIALSLDDSVSDVVRTLIVGMRENGGSAHVTPELVDRELGPGAAGVSSPRMTQWLSNLESGRGAVIYESNPRTPAWTAQCIRQSDRLVLVATPREELRLDELAMRLRRVDGVPRQIQLVLVHPRETELPSGTRVWLELEGISRIHHVKSGERRDVERVVRHLLGRPIGVALGGGGARGIAHLGVLAAMAEAEVPIDYICGTSMGSIFAAATAQGWSPERQRASVRELFARPFSLYDLTVPIVSLLAGKKLDRVMRNYYADAEIEDLWLPFFCVSTDLARGSQVVHERGSLWKSVRASCSIPGIFPPLALGDRLLVDGGLMNNLPVDLLSERCPGTLVSVDVYPWVDPSFRRPAGFFASHIRRVRTRLKGEEASPPLFDILARSTFVGSRYRQATATAHMKNLIRLEPPVGACGILRWRAHEELFETGYRYAKEQLASSPLSGLVHRLAA